MGNYLLTESLYSTITVYIILKKIMTDFKYWDAYKLGIIDENGKKLKHPKTSREREAWDMLTRLCWNIKRLTTKFLGKSKFATYFTAAYLLKDSLSPLYLQMNKNKLDEEFLFDMTFFKQHKIYEVIKKIDESEIKVDDLKNLDLYIYKVLDKIEEKIDLDSLKDVLFEDEVISSSNPTVQADVAQVSYPIGISTKRFKKKNKKIQRRFHESNR